MSVTKEMAQTLFDLFLVFSKKVAIESHKYIGSHNRITGYDKYPVINMIFPKDNPEYLKYYQEIPFLTHDIPRYELREFPKERIQYGAIFNGYSDDKLNIKVIDGFNDLLEYISNTPELEKLLVEDNRTDSIQYRLKSMASGIVERYLYSINATHLIPEDLENQLKPFIAETLLRYIDTTLKIDICVPVCLATFEDETIKLAEQVEIVRIPDHIQKSRKQACTYESNNEDWLAACATHMIVLHGYHFKNDEYTSINTVTRNYHAYPLHLIDDIMAVIRTVTGYTIGYEQILSLPIGWIDGFCADLTPIYGAKSHFVNAREIEKFWMQLPISFINSKQAQEIQRLYSVVLSCDGDKRKGNLSFALKRLNRCMLRDEDDDMAIDATIGLESLLSGVRKARLLILFLIECLLYLLMSIAMCTLLRSVGRQ
ncbi:hypothetical protein [Aminipila terrae]|uniref:Uncharacterized protein n=1 Tax=Aminipila terrae TaxID=2697030 RepID=A0A6P1MN08_9FIRM|nr:hypothetical protein [Aminipila terrae]QHI73478.1 hypothetical protein Ami3637_14810 [Aminipila terrae]